MEDLEEILGSIRKYTIHLLPRKFSFRVHAKRFPDFMFMNPGILADLDKFQGTINTRNSTNVKEV